MAITTVSKTVIQGSSPCTPATYKFAEQILRGWDVKLRRDVTELYVPKQFVRLALLN
ncbi:MAG: hypothetical protein G01um101448_939 [Parcubacteria group bacterium Gr01-1014_48]|nr:MAG: hypothetical protein G01um101448_939 [Parcubacteria group bacterium Gr01-1014_48]